ncbi:MAG TPA: hypothetical protein PK513_02455 [Alphaproteobacteria bacterium]|mgnify:CR=1 FL=1|nr:hypothetical protein [Alphaproteobacteria bacterium]USO05915.1 MAG: hypothetical protein H6859_01545 [Rhodospirillales bacterium]HOO81347.1 hypothetical protein [Alphaproteobacteria bacterium]
MEKWKKKFAGQAFAAATLTGVSLWSGFATKSFLDERDVLRSGPEWDGLVAEFKPLYREYCERSLLSSDLRAALENQREQIVQRAVDSSSPVSLRDYVFLSGNVPFPSEERIGKCQSEIAMAAAQDAVYEGGRNKLAFTSLAVLSGVLSAGFALVSARSAVRTYRRREEDEPVQGPSASAPTSSHS